MRHITPQLNTKMRLRTRILAAVLAVGCLGGLAVRLFVLMLRDPGGYALRAITYDKDKQTYTVACTTAALDTTAQAISQLVSKVEELETSNTALAAQVDYISMMTDTEVA